MATRSSSACSTPNECAALAALYGRRARFRSRVVMEQHGFGRGEYQYFALPAAGARRGAARALYPRLAPIANRWNEALRHRACAIPPSTTRTSRAATPRGRSARRRCCCATAPATTTACTRTSTASTSSRSSSPSCSPSRARLHGGEFLLTEQRPRMQSRAEVVPLAQGDAVVFAVRHRPVQGTRGTLPRDAAPRRRAACAPASATRSAIIFHDAK